MRLGSLHSLRLNIPQRQLIKRYLPTRSRTDPCCYLLVRRPFIKRQSVLTRAEEVKGNGSVEPCPLDFEELTDLIKMVNDSDIVDFEIQNKGITLSLKKAEALEDKKQTMQAAAFPYPSMQTVPAFDALSPQAQVPFPTAQSPPFQTNAPLPSPKTEETEEIDGVQITSPMSGCFYSAPAPGEPAFVKVGDRVSIGQTVCIIEAMKLMNEIEAEISGEVVKILAQNGDSIVAGQALLIVRPT